MTRDACIPFLISPPIFLVLRHLSFCTSSESVFAKEKGTVLSINDFAPVQHASGSNVLPLLVLSNIISPYPGEAGLCSMCGLCIITATVQMYRSRRISSVVASGLYLYVRWRSLYCRSTMLTTFALTWSAAAIFFYRLFLQHLYVYLVYDYIPNMYVCTYILCWCTK